jgi:site-specific DNA-adenine methylase
MKYVGGKHTISKELCNFIMSRVDTTKDFYDLFCGSCGIVKNMQFKKVIANDIETDLYLFWKDDFALDFFPNEIEYKSYKHDPNPSQKRCFYRFFMSYGGKSWGGYLERHCIYKDRNFFNEFKNSYNKIKPMLKNVEFYNKSYLDFDMEDAVIYCDPPYEGTQGYGSSFDTNQFWERMKYLSQKNIVFISCEKHPDDFVVVWKKEKIRTLQREKRLKEELLVQYKK